MMNKLKKQKSDVKLLILNIIIVILAIVMVNVLWAVGDEALYCFAAYENKESSFYYAIESGSYDRIVYMYHENVVNGYEDKSDLEESHGVAKYFEAAFFYKMFEEAGDAQRAQVQKTAMEEATLQMGEMTFLADQINEKLDIAE